MKEDLLHYIWKKKLFDKENLYTISGKPVEVIKIGVQNQHAGPDFFNAKIKIGNEIWAGNVEIHIKSSDWYLHKHDTDKAYDNVILHVVYEYDCNIQRTAGDLIETLVLRFDPHIEQCYEELILRENWLKCSTYLDQVDPFIIQFFFNRVLVDRLESKVSSIKRELVRNCNDWHQTFYLFLMSSFGGNVNAEPFEYLAKSLPLRILAKHKNSVFQIEALMYGMAGFFSKALSQKSDEYSSKLSKEFEFLRSKYNLVPLKVHIWKFLRMRPANFPTIRISQFAQLLVKSTELFTTLLYADSIDTIRNYFDVETTTYWETHYNFNTKSPYSVKKLGKQTIDSIIINAIVPLIFIFGEENNKTELKRKAIELLDQLPYEKNSITDYWKKKGGSIKSASDSQAILQLKKRFCDKSACLNCEIGTHIISKVY